MQLRNYAIIRNNKAFRDVMQQVQFIFHRFAALSTRIKLPSNICAKFRKLSDRNTTFLQFDHLNYCSLFLTRSSAMFKLVSRDQLSHSSKFLEQFI